MYVSLLQRSLQGGFQSKNKYNIYVFQFLYHFPLVKSLKQFTSMCNYISSNRYKNSMVNLQ